MKKTFLIMLLSTLSLNSVFAGEKKQSPHLVALKEMRINILANCSKTGIVTHNNVVLSAKASIEENVRPQDYNFQLIEKNSPNDYSIINNNELWLTLKNKKSMRVGTLETSLQEFYDGLSTEKKEECIFLGEGNFFLKANLNVKISENAQYIINADEIEKKCESKSTFFQPSIDGKKTVNAPYVLVNVENKSIFLKSVMKDINYNETCRTAGTVTKGTATVGGYILSIPGLLLVSIVAALGGGFN